MACGVYILKVTSKLNLGGWKWNCLDSYLKENHDFVIFKTILANPPMELAMMIKGKKFKDLGDSMGSVVMCLLIIYLCPIYNLNGVIDIVRKQLRGTGVGQLRANACKGGRGLVALPAHAFWPCWEYMEEMVNIECTSESVKNFSTVSGFYWAILILTS